MENHKEGKVFGSESQKRSGQDEASTAEHAGSERFGVHGEKKDKRLALSLGKTIELASFTFARIDFSIEADLVDGANRDDLFDALDIIVNEMIAREYADVVGSTRQSIPIVTPASATNITIFVQYGLTLPTKKRFESTRIDFGHSQPVTNGGDLEAELKALCDYVTDRLAKRRERVEAGDSIESFGL